MKGRIPKHRLDGSRLLEHAVHDCGGADSVHRHLEYNGRPWKEQHRREVPKVLREAIDKWKTDNNVTGPVRETLEKPTPNPYWRSSVSPHLLLPPDVVSDSAYTICWAGVVSPVVCISGARVCR